jgi:hypothetical protein
VRDLADNLSAALTIVQAVVSIVSITLSLILLAKLRQLIRSVTGIPGAAAKTVRKGKEAAWGWLTSWYR